MFCRVSVSVLVESKTALASPRGSDDLVESKTALASPRGSDDLLQQSHLPVVCIHDIYHQYLHFVYARTHPLVGTPYLPEQLLSIYSSSELHWYVSISWRWN